MITGSIFLHSGHELLVEFPKNEKILKSQVKSFEIPETSAAFQYVWH